MRKTTEGLDGVFKEHVEFLQIETQPIPLALEAVPTAAVPLLDDNEEGVYGGVLYKRVGATIYVITPSSTITIT